jgi:hypothetical protein
MEIMNFFMTRGGLKEEKNTSRLVYFGDGVNTFQGFRSITVIQNQCQHVPFVSNVHYMVHQTNLQYKPSYTYQIIYLTFESILQLVFMFILSIAPRDLEFTKMVKIIEIKGSKILHIKTMC